MDFSHLLSAELSDPGRKRKNNEDACLRLPAAGVFCVADGMGGALDGEVASRAVIDAVAEAFSGRHAPADMSFDDSRRLIKEAALNANAWILDHATDRGTSGTGSTLVAMVFDSREPRRAAILHAGDSRAYRFRGETLTRLTMDHSLVAEAGIEEESRLGPMFRSLITRAIGIKPSVELEETPTGALEDDLFMLCSDGLTSMLTDQEILAVLRENRTADLQELAYHLVDAANRRGGIDNVTVLLVKIGKFPREAGMPATPASEMTESARQPPVPAKQAGPDSDFTPHTDGGSFHEPAAPGQPPPTPTSDLECFTPASTGLGDSGGTRPGDRSPTTATEPGKATETGNVISLNDLVDTQSAPVKSAQPGGKRFIARAAAVAGIVIIAAVFAGHCRRNPDSSPGSASSQPPDMSTSDNILPPPVIQAPEAGTAKTGGPATPPRTAGDRLSRTEMDNMRRMLPTRIDSTLLTGEWGHMADHLDKWSPVIDGYLVKSGRETIFAGWHDIWNRVNSGEINPAESYAEYKREIDALCRRAVFPPPPEEPDLSWGGTAAARADTYCRATYRLQRHMSENIGTLTAKLQAEADVLGTEPHATLSALWLFVGDGDENSLLAVSTISRNLTNDVNRLDRWILACGDSPMGLGMVRSIPSQIVPGAIGASVELKQQIESRLAMIPSHVALWRRQSTRDAQQTLDRIEQSYGRIYPAGKDSAKSPWQDSAGRKALKAMLADIRSARGITGR